MSKPNCYKGFNFDFCSTNSSIKDTGNGTLVFEAKVDNLTSKKFWSLMWAENEFWKNTVTDLNMRVVTQLNSRAFHSKSIDILWLPLKVIRLSKMLMKRIAFSLPNWKWWIFQYLTFSIFQNFATRRRKFWSSNRHQAISKSELIQKLKGFHSLKALKLIKCKYPVVKPYPGHNLRVIKII